MTEQTCKHLVGIYPGTFDPMTKGHLHLIQRASGLVDHLIIGVADNARKNPMFTTNERLEMARIDIGNLPEKQCSMEVIPFQGLLVDFARNMEASCIFRGLRAISDFEFEFQMTGMNAKLDPEIETLFLMASEKWQFVSSSFIKEICALGGDISPFVTPNVQAQLKTRLSESQGHG